MTEISVAIPFSGESPLHFRQAVRSVFAQTFTDWTLTLIADGARSDLVREARAIRDSRVEVLADGHSRGLAARLNESVRRSRGTYYARMDADDVMLPTRLEREAASLDSDPEVDVTGTRALVIDDHSRAEGLLRESPEIPRTVSGFLVGNAMTHPSVMGRTEWFSANPYDEMIGRAEDKELWLRTADRAKFCKLEEALLAYRVPLAYRRRKAVRTMTDDALVSLRFRGAGPSKREKYVAATRSFVKAGVYAVLPSSRWASIRARRVEEIASDRMEYLRAQLLTSLDTPVPGWDD